jgi:quercetin dioxygenase-like cupin family protein
MSGMDEPYHVTSVTVLASGPGVLAREFVFGPGEGTPWHRHSAVEDRSYVLSGALVFETRDPPTRVELAAGDSHLIAAGTVHRVTNRGAADARLLLVQHGGRYDFLNEPDGGRGAAEG